MRTLRAGKETTMVAVHISTVHQRSGGVSKLLGELVGAEDYSLPAASSTLKSVTVYTTKRARLTAMVIRPSENTPHRAIFWRLRNLRQLMMKKGRINTATWSTISPYIYTIRTYRGDQ